MPHGSVLRIEPVRPKDNNQFVCIADNGIGEAVRAVANLTVYLAEGGK